IDEICPARGEWSFTVKHEDVFWLRTQGNVKIHAGNGSCTGTAYHKGDLVDFFVDQFKRIEQGCCGDDRGSMLVVMHHRNIKFFFEPFLDFETFRTFDVFQIDPSESGFQCFDYIDKFIGIVDIQFEIKDVDVCIYFK